MKKLILFIAICVSLMSCTKEQLGFKCNCGKVLSDDVSTYSVVIRNNCSNNEKRFYLQPGDWMDAFVGSEYCITNVDRW